jgi:hypothetical protein
LWPIINQFPGNSGRAVIVLGDAGYASVDNMKYIQNRAKNEWKQNKVYWWFVFAIAKTWKFSDGKSLRDLATHIKKLLFPKHYLIVNSVIGRLVRALTCDI